MKLVVKRTQTEDDACAWITFSQEGMPGLVLSEYEISPFVEALENIQEHSSECFHENVRVQRQVESVIISRLTTRDEVLIKLTQSKSLKLASALRSSYPEYF